MGRRGTQQPLGRFVVAMPPQQFNRFLDGYVQAIGDLSQAQRPFAQVHLTGDVRGPGKRERPLAILVAARVLVEVMADLRAQGEKRSTGKRNDLLGGEGGRVE